ncbi:MAG: UDP-N-acetylmuramate--L-alanine ligase [Deltaproteobacteria bacterium]|nr:UDP-N-acetylmuramate--L-alanine ligase [Deltaproteobacteria bacterium]
MFRQYQHIHFVGIGGIGMSGIAEVLLTLGYAVSGSDLRSSAITRHLKRRGARIAYGHKREQINGAHVVVTSSAIVGTNPEVREARARGIPVVPRAEMLAELMRLKYGIAIAGTHGKTTTTSLIAHVLAGGGLDPTIVIGGRVNSWRTNARLGKGNYLVAEADESDRSFLKLTPTIAIITNIDPEHMENYRNFADVRRAYLAFAEKVPFYGFAVCCVDHPEVRAMRRQCTRPVMTYGITESADFTATRIRQIEDRLHFTVLYRGTPLGEVALQMPGRHNVVNALAAVAVGHLLEVPFAKIVRGLARFKGIERRFQVLYRHGPLVVNDYAHHPAELRATIQAARDGWPQRRVIVVHQPHRYSRLCALFREFVDVLAEADAVILMRLYAAGESPLPGISARRLWGMLRRRSSALSVKYAEAPEKVVELVEEMTTPEDIVLFLGAGDIWKVGMTYARRVKR